VSGDLAERFAVVEQFAPAALQAFMRRDDIYWAITDALAPAPESMNFIDHMLHPDVWTLVATFDGHIFGFCQFNRRTSVGAEFHCAFHQGFRGVIARTVCQYAIKRAWDKGMLKLWAPVPSDNRAALFGARHLGFREEGRLTRAIVRRVPDGEVPLRDLVLMALSKGEEH
jgi:RimJ/RimL family protein N-acetyltransferase